jgi:wyosine [tRNA(Phe)-imidazoG37] synthetase (radical SAM superfamily)
VQTTDVHIKPGAARAKVSSPALSRTYLGNEFVYCVISQRAHGLSVGVNMNPDKRCNFDCVYCEVDREQRHRGSARVGVHAMIEELQRVLHLAHTKQLRQHSFEHVPDELLTLREVALSGDGEPTLCPNFSEVVQAVAHLRAKRLIPFFKIVLITNCSGLHLLDVQEGVNLLTREDEVWAKLDAGTQTYMEAINRTEIRIEQVLENILELGKKRPVIIQSLFARIDGADPPDKEIEAYAQRLRELKEGGANISLVQIYSAHRPVVNQTCVHLPLRALSRIAKRVREISGLQAEVF